MNGYYTNIVVLVLRIYAYIKPNDMKLGKEPKSVLLYISSLPA